MTSVTDRQTDKQMTLQVTDVLLMKTWCNRVTDKTTVCVCVCENCTANYSVQCAYGLDGLTPE